MDWEEFIKADAVRGFAVRGFQSHYKDGLTVLPTLQEWQDEKFTGKEPHWIDLATVSMYTVNTPNKAVFALLNSAATLKSCIQ